MRQGQREIRGRASRRPKNFCCKAVDPRTIAHGECGDGVCTCREMKNSGRRDTKLSGVDASTRNGIYGPLAVTPRRMLRTSLGHGQLRFVEVSPFKYACMFVHILFRLFDSFHIPHTEHHIHPTLRTCECLVIAKSDRSSRDFQGSTSG
jgi:hypothetical protein